MKNYGKILLYSYGKLNKLSLELKKLAEEKAVAAFYSPYDCYSVAEQIIRLNDAKSVIDETKNKMDEVLVRFSKEELEFFEYRYFKRRVETTVRPLIDSDRKYYRKQNSLFKKFLEIAMRHGLTEEWFDENCLPLNYFKRMCELYETKNL